MLRVTADSNIYVSALHFGGMPDRLLDLARAGEIQLSVSDDIIGEVRRVLREKFGWSPEALDLAEARIADFTEHVVPTATIDAVKDDPTDNRILECAVSGNSDALVTGDKHLLRLAQFSGIRILKVAEFLHLVNSQTRVK